MRIPKRETIEKQMGRARRLGKTTSEGRRARDAKSVAGEKNSQLSRYESKEDAKREKTLTVND